MLDGVSDFSEQLLDSGDHVTLALELLCEDLHDLAVAQLLILGLNLALLAEDERVLAVGVTVLVEALQAEKKTFSMSSVKGGSNLPCYI